MKRFEFRLSRVLDLRRKQAELHRTRLLSLLAGMKALDAEKESLEKTVVEARRSLRSAPLTGNDLISLSHYETHIRRRCAALSAKKIEAEKQLKIEQHHTREAERKVKLLEKLETKRRGEWQSEANKELDRLAADAYLSRRHSLARLEQANAEAIRMAAERNS
jgi:flagellar export protein FliJ